jgi:agmatine deiminase
MNLQTQSASYRMPAEWETHAATQLHWPSNRETWPGRRLNRVEEVYLDIIEVLHRYEPVVLLADRGVPPKLIRTRLSERDIDPGRVHLFQPGINDVWARDCGPVFVFDESDSSKPVITDWEYNAWGGKYPPYDDDNNLPRWFSGMFDLPAVSVGMVLEGGSIDVNGEGVLLTTESVLLNSNRNPELTKEEIEFRLRNFLGTEQIIWLGEGLAGDDTDGHIDDLSRFLNRNTILTMVCENEEDINAEALSENYRRLEEARNAAGEPFRLVTLPLPETRIEGATVDGSVYVPASYANFYIANGVVLVPLYDERYDEEAMSLFAGHFPGRDIAGIPSADLVWGQGSIHCITQQLYGIDPELLAAKSVTL